jgi:uncharacterized protein YcbX
MTLAQLWIYPIKSCAGVQLSQAELTDTGLDLDRAWMVVDADGRFVTQRQLPRMALIQPALRSTELVLRAPGMLALHLPLDQVAHPVIVQVWKDRLSAYDMGDLAAQWVSDFLSMDVHRNLPTPAQPYRLIRFDPDHRRLADKQWTAGQEVALQFSDGFPLLVLSLGSLDAFNQQLRAAGHRPVGIERFRPNLVLAGWPAHAEDQIEELELAGADAPIRLRLVKPCTRCNIPNIDPATGLSDPAVGMVLKTYRQDPRMQGRLTFGMNAIVSTGVNQWLRVGQPVSHR